MSRLPMCSSVCSLLCELYTQRRAESFGNSKEIPWKIFGGFFKCVVGGSYGPSARIPIRVWPFPYECRRAAVVARRRGPAAFAQGVRSAAGSSRAPGAAARERRVDEVGLARHVRRGGQSLLHHFTDPQGARPRRRIAAIHRDGS